MNKLTSIAVIIIVGIAVLVFFIRDMNLTSSNTNSSANVSNVGSSIIRIVRDNQQIVTSPKYRFTFTVPASFKYSLESANDGIAPVEDSVHTLQVSLVFSQPNNNTSDKKNRETPNGFNTSSTNDWVLNIYRNDTNVTMENTASLNAWLKRKNLGDVNNTMEVLKLNNQTIDYMIQADGVDSRGNYYYVITAAYIFVFGTGDYSNVQMQALLSGFKIT